MQKFLTRTDLTLRMMKGTELYACRNLSGNV